jgi:TolB-like protein
LRAARRADGVCRRSAEIALLLAAIGLLPALPRAASGAPAQPPGEKPTIAVLRFRVHSSKPLDYLGESLANLVRTRLEASGEVRVLDASATPDARAATAEAQAGDAALRQLAADVGADYIVTGSVTELAGRYSLDVRATPAAIALRGHTLVLTAERDEELLARVNEVSDGLLAQVVGAAPAVVAKLELVGAGADEAALREGLATRVGAPFDPATVREDLARLRQDASIGTASVETERGPEGVIVRFKLVRAERLLAGGGEPPETDRVASVTVRGNRRIEASAILARVGTKAGARYSPAQIARDVREVQALGFFRNVRVFSEQTPEGRRVIVEVEESPVVRQISISGNESIDGEKIRDILTLTTGATLDYPLPGRGLLPRRRQLRHRAARRSLGQHQLRRQRGREAQAARDRVRRQRAFQRPRVARWIPDPDLALLVAGDLLVRPLGHLLGAALHPGSARRREALHRLGLPARRGGRADRGGRQGGPDGDGLDPGRPALPGRQARDQGRRHRRPRGVARAAGAQGG